MTAPESERPVARVEVEVRYAETDQMGVVYYVTYPFYFEIGRSEFMRTKGFTYREFEERGFHLVVVSMEAKYHGNATYDDLITVKTGISARLNGRRPSRISQYPFGMKNSSQAELRKI